ncbi:DUF58 domain-containing protein [Lujinxingia litoralis]|uniref:DUF58 domain-containing protein n=1 Tax=Lujinxingia litoralis TaxID=2211119 RepID=A0A328C5U5_9DELT|nr:DUF58 domain-containing protein [Lujinxingia litoralis]RAL22376.1 DUF58 domain-containing protein [Lujinxingia litoralis]
MVDALRQTYLNPATLDQLGDMHVRARQLAQGVIAGLHRSPHRGGSVEFSEYTEYSAGQELRRVDWKVYGKSDKYYVKQFEDETNLQAFLLMDGSGSMAFQSELGPLSKLDHARYVAATLAYLFIRQGDAVGALGFAETPGAFLPAASRGKHLDDIFYLLDNLPASGPTALDASLRQIAERARRRSLVLIFSDLLDASERTEELLRVLASRNFDVAVFQVLDPAELSLPYEGLSLFEGLEDDGELLADPDDLRDRYIQTMRAHNQRLEELCTGANIAYLRYDTTRPIERVCQDFLRGRG